MPLADDDLGDLGVERIQTGAQVPHLAVDLLHVRGHRRPSGGEASCPIVAAAAAVDNGPTAGHDGRHEAHVLETIRPDRGPRHGDAAGVVQAVPRQRRGGRGDGAGPADAAGAGFTEEEIAEGETLLGWFDPLELPTAWSGEAVNVHDMLHRLVIYKRPLEDEYPERKRLLIEVRKTVIHELAHHFGWTDADLEKFDDNPDPFGDGFGDLQ